MPRRDLHHLSAVCASLLFVFLTACDGDEPAPASPDASADAALMPEPEPEPEPEADAAPEPEPDAAPDPEPEPPPIDPARVVEPEALAQGPVTATAPLADGRLVAGGPDGVLLIDGSIPSPLGVEPGALRAAALVDGELLVAGEAGLFALVEGALLPSPLGALLRDVTALHATADGALWLVDADGLHVWRDGELSAVTPATMRDASGPAATGRWADASALWLADDAALYAIGFGAEGLQAWAVDAEAPIDAVAVNDEGGVWLAAAGALWHLGADGDWRAFVLPFAVTGLAASSAAPDVWIDAAGSLWQYREGRFRPIEGVGGYGGLVAEVDGSVLLYGEQGLHRVRPGRFVALVGVTPGAIVDRELTLVIEPTRPDQVTTVEQRLDGGAPAAVDGPPWQLTLSPLTVADGPHTLRVAVTYDDGERIEAEVAFRVQGPPTWQDDIQPIFIEHCEQCHGPRGGAHLMAEMEIWVDEIDDLIDAIVGNRMPLPPNPAVRADQLELIRRWRDTGFTRSLP